MTTKFENNVLTVVTEIAKEVVERGISSLTAKDDKGNEVFAVSVSNSGCASLSTFGFTGNTYIDGKLAATMVMPMDTTRADIEKKYGEALLAAKKYTAQIAEEAAEKAADIDALFDAE